LPNVGVQSRQDGGWHIVENNSCQDGTGTADPQAALSEFSLKEQSFRHFIFSGHEADFIDCPRIRIPYGLGDRFGKITAREIMAVRSRPDGTGRASRTSTCEETGPLVFAEK
jgi:hypothetical protein